MKKKKQTMDVVAYILSDRLNRWVDEELGRIFKRPWKHEGKMIPHTPGANYYTTAGF